MRKREGKRKGKWNTFGWRWGLRKGREGEEEREDGNGEEEEEVGHGCERERNREISENLNGSWNVMQARNRRENEKLRARWSWGRGRYFVFIVGVDAGKTLRPGQRRQLVW